MRTLRAVLAVLFAALFSAVLCGAYGYPPPEAGRSFRSPYLQAAGSRFVDTPVARFHLVDGLWAPATFHDNLRAMYLLERGLDWGETESAMPTTRTPTLLPWGGRDRVVPAWQARRIGELMPDARVEVLDGCGHAVQMDCAEPVNRLLRDFL